MLSSSVTRDDRVDHLTRTMTSAHGFRDVALTPVVSPMTRTPRFASTRLEYDILSHQYITPRVIVRWTRTALFGRGIVPAFRRKVSTTCSPNLARHQPRRDWPPVAAPPGVAARRPSSRRRANIALPATAACAHASPPGPSRTDASAGIPTTSADPSLAHFRRARLASCAGGRILSFTRHASPSLAHSGAGHGSLSRHL